MDAFGQHLHRVAAKVGENFTASPLSIAVAFGMLRAGARGSTGSQIDAVFGFPTGPAPQGSPHQALNALTASLVTDQPVPLGPAPTASGAYGPKPIVAMANALFVAESFRKAVAPAFVELLARDYGARTSVVNFTSGQAKKTIDAWVVTQTRGRIKKLFDSLDPDTLLVLANAVYLKAAWLDQFTSPTTTADFTTTAGTMVPAKLMHQSLEAATYAETAQWQRITMPYVGGELSMRIVLPRAAVRSLAALTTLLPVATDRTAPDQRVIVDLSLPRWDTGTDLDLFKPLVSLGMPDAFSPGADFSGLAPGLQVTQAIHRANITVDEKGTEAAAVTGIGMGTSAVVGTPVVMRVDRPFVWAVVHEPTGAPVFVGHVVDPTK